MFQCFLKNPYECWYLISIFKNFMSFLGQFLILLNRHKSERIGCLERDPEQKMPSFWQLVGWQGHKQLSSQWGGIRGLATTSWSQPGCIHTASAFSMSWPHLLGMLPKRSLILTYKLLSKLIQQAFYLKPSPKESVQWVFSLLSRSL